MMDITVIMNYRYNGYKGYKGYNGYNRYKGYNGYNVLYPPFFSHLIFLPWESLLIQK